jgi:chloramphenicol 3-O-phosphotransferase
VIRRQRDRRAIDRRLVEDLTPDAPLNIPGIDEPVREGTLQRTLLVSSQPALLRMAAALDYLQQYPYGCTEQRISLAMLNSLRLMDADSLLNMQANQERERSERHRYLTYYGIDLDDRTIYDLVVDSTSASPEEIAKSILAAATT